MSRLLSVAVAVLLARFVLAGTAIDLGPHVALSAAASLALGIGWGLVSRIRMPYIADSLGLALLVPARGLLSDLVGSALPLSWAPAPHLAAVVSVVPVGYVLGRQLSSVARESPLPLMLGWALGELLVVFGAVAWLPGPFTGFVGAGLLAMLVELGRHRRIHRDGASEIGTAWEALPVGVVFGLVVFAFRRVVAGYAPPPPHSGSEVVLAFLFFGSIIAVFVALFVWLMEGKAWARRTLATVGGLLLAVALWKTTASLGLHLQRMAHVGLTMDVKGWVARWADTIPWIDEYRVWLCMFAGYGAAGFGMVIGSLRGGSAGPFSLGVGLAILGQFWLDYEPTWGPSQLMLVACGLALGSTALCWGRWGLVALPLVALPLWAFPTEHRSSFDGIYRVGEHFISGFQRRRAADVALYSTPGPSNLSAYGRMAYRTSFTDREPDLLLLESPPEPPDPDLDPDDAGPRELEKHLGVRVAGAPMHAGHDPMGPQGAVGRWTRIFARPGRTWVTGIGAELLAADGTDAGWPTDIDVSSALPFGKRLTLQLFDHIGSAGFASDVRDDPVRASREAEPGGYDTVLVAPERVEWPWTESLSLEGVQRLSALLAPGGRCLAWIDTTAMSARALSGRLAAFGSVFGNRSAAFVEARELDPPLVLLVGWLDDAGRPSADEVLARLPGPDPSGLRTRLRDLADVHALLLLDGEGLAAAAEEGPVHRAGRPLPTSGLAHGGWAAVAGVRAGSPAPRISRLFPEAEEPEERDTGELLAGLAVHTEYSYHLDRLKGSLVIELLPDVDWTLFDREVEHYARAAAADSEQPLLHLALAALLSPLAREGDYGRFVSVFRRTGAAEMRSWRLALLQAFVLRESLEETEARAALERADRWRAAEAGT